MGIFRSCCMLNEKAGKREWYRYTAVSQGRKKDCVGYMQGGRRMHHDESLPYEEAKHADDGFCDCNGNLLTTMPKDAVAFDDSCIGTELGSPKTNECQPRAWMGYFCLLLIVAVNRILS